MRRAPGGGRRLQLRGFSALTAVTRHPGTFAAAALLWPLLDLNRSAYGLGRYTVDQCRVLAAERAPLARLRTVTVPLLVLHGDVDSTPVDDVRRIEEEVPGAQVHVFAGDGHGLQRNIGEVCRRLTLFLSAQLRSASP